MPDKGQQVPHQADGGIDGPTLLARFARRCVVDEAKSCWIWQGAVWSKSGYAKFRLYGREYKVYQVLGWLYHGYDRESGMAVCHRCNNKLCVNPVHLYVATQAQNARDAHRDGLCFGKTRKLTNVEVYQALQWSLWGLSDRGVARRLGMAKQTITSIVDGENLSYMTYAMHLPRRRHEIKIPRYFQAKYAA